MLKSQKISRRSALKSLLIASAIPTVFLSSCAKNLTSPEVPKDQSSTLYKSHLNSTIATLENYIVASNEKGFVEIPSKYLHGGKSEKSEKVVLTRVGENDFVLIFRKAEVISKDGQNYLIKVNGLSNGAVLIANPKLAVQKLKKIDRNELKRKFLLGRKLKRGGES